MENLKYTRPNVWTELLNKLNKSIWQQVMEGTKETLGLVDEESHRRDVHIYRQKSYFARRDVQQPERPSAMTGQLKRTATKLGLRKPDPPPYVRLPARDGRILGWWLTAVEATVRVWAVAAVHRKEDIEMSNDPLNDAEVVKQVIAAQNREYRVRRAHAPPRCTGLPRTEPSRAATPLVGCLCGLPSRGSWSALALFRPPCWWRRSSTTAGLSSPP